MQAFNFFAVPVLPFVSVCFDFLYICLVHKTLNHRKALCKLKIGNGLLPPPGRPRHWDPGFHCQSHFTARRYISRACESDRSPERGTPLGSWGVISTDSPNKTTCSSNLGLSTQLGRTHPRISRLVRASWSRQARPHSPPSLGEHAFSSTSPAFSFTGRWRSRWVR